MSKPPGTTSWSGSITEAGTEMRSYYGRPIVKEPTWTWEIPTYFFTGGLAGGSAGLAYLSELRGNEVLARRAWASAMAGLAISPGLLISDLGKPLRFINMLRMFKVTSPMSVGSWVLMGSGATTALAAAESWIGLFPRLGRAAKPAAAFLGLPLSTYTAALIANTAVPVWHDARRELPFMFAAGAALSAAGAGLITTPVQHAAPARRLALGAAAVELASSFLMEKRLGEIGEPYSTPPASRLKRIAATCVSAGAAVVAARAGRSRAAALAGGTLMLAGALSARWNVYKAGFESAADPKYVIGPQRARVDAGRPRSGLAARTDARISTEPLASVGSPANSDRE
jgi:hypothetical protein